jgi:PPOX class probable F420-dependent enzyme
MSDLRLQTNKNMWLATVRPDGRPHLTPIWFAVHDEKWYFVTDPSAVKAQNLQHNPRVSLALEDGSDPYVVEGVARQVSPSPEVIQLFKKKFDWDITADAQYSVVFEVEVLKHLMGKE